MAAVSDYLGGTSAGWISLGPRPQYSRLRRSPVMKPVDETDVWSVVCSYVPRAWRGRGLQHRLQAGFTEVARRSPTRVVMRLEL
jgi:hypothetical protein